MAFIKKIWKDRISQFPNRRTINDGYVTKQVTVGRDEGTITEQGDAFDAANMNDLEQRIEDCYGDVQALVGAEVAAQYNQDNVIFDPVATVGHGTGFVVSSDYIANLKVGDLADTDISGQAQGEALVWDGSKWVNGTVSTVGNLDDLNDVDTTGKASGDSLRYDGNDWVAKPTTIACTQAQYNTWKNATPSQLKKGVHYVITDAPNLNPTASDIEYSSGVTVADKLTSLDTNKADKTLTSGTVTASSNVTVARYTLKQFGNIKFLSLALYVTVAHSSGAKLASLSITPTQMLDMVAVAKPSQNACAWNVDTDGYLYTNDAMQTGQTYYLNAWYI